MKKKIFINRKAVKGPWGGENSFMGALCKFLEKNYELTTNIDSNFNLALINALTLINYEDIKKILVESDINRSFVCDIIQDSKIIDTKEDALNYIGKSAMHVIPKEKREIYASQMLCNELFPHLGTTCSIINKALFLGYMLNKLIFAIDMLEI